MDVAQARRPRRRPGPAGPCRTSGPPRSCGTRSSSSTGRRRARARAGRSRGRRSRRGRARRAAARALRRHAEALEQRRVERGVAEPDAVASETGARRARGRARSPPRPSPRAPREPISSIPACRNSRGWPRCGRIAAVAVREVGEAQRQLRAGVAGADDARDRDRHVRAQHQHLAVLVEDAVGRPRRRRARRGRAPTRTRARACRSRRSRRRRTTARRLLGDRAQLAHLVGQHVARAAGNRNDHRPGDGSGRRRRAAQARARSRRPRARAEHARRSAQELTRSICAPSARRRSSMRS